MDERSEVDAEVEASDVREEGSLARDRDWWDAGGGSGAGRRVVVVEVDDVDTDLEIEDNMGGGFVPGRWGSFGGWGLGMPLALLRAFSQSKGMVVVGLIADVTDTFSNESAMLTTSPSTLPSLPPIVPGDDRVDSLGLGGFNSFPSEESDTEWNDEMEEPGAWRMRTAPKAWVRAGGYVCSTESESGCPGGRRVALLSEIEQMEIESVDEYEGLRGGSGGRDLGGDSKLMSGVEEIGAELAIAGLLAIGGGVLLNSRMPFRRLSLLMGMCGETADTASFGPSSTIQSFRSINDVFRPRFGGDGDGDLLDDFGGVYGAIG